MRTDPQIITRSVCVRLDVSIWSARARLTRGDLPTTANLPPEELATMGSKRLFDPVKLRPFNALKARAISALDKVGCRFLGGWLISDDAVDTVDKKLGDIAEEFKNARDEFAQAYSQGTAEWMDTFPQWADILKTALPSEAEIPTKFSFSWQMFKVQPVTSQHTGEGENTIARDIEGIGQQTVQEIIHMLEDLYKECFDNKDTVTARALRPVVTVVDKLDAMSFTHPVVSGLRAVLFTALKNVTGKTQDQGAVETFKLTLRGMMSMDNIERIIESYNTGVINADGACDAFWAAHVLPQESEEPELSIVDAVDDTTVESSSEEHAPEESQVTDPLLEELGALW